MRARSDRAFIEVWGGLSQSIGEGVVSVIDDLRYSVVGTNEISRIATFVVFGLFSSWPCSHFILELPGLFVFVGRFLHAKLWTGRARDYDW